MRKNVVWDLKWVLAIWSGREGVKCKLDAWHHLKGKSFELLHLIVHNKTKKVHYGSAFEVFCQAFESYLKKYMSARI